MVAPFRAENAGWRVAVAVNKVISAQDLWDLCRSLTGFPESIHRCSLAEGSMGSLVIVVDDPGA